VTTQQANTPAGTTYAWVLTTGNSLTLTLTSSTGDVIVTTSAPTSGAVSFLATVGHATLARNVSITQSGVTWIYKGVATATTQVLGSIVATKRILFRLCWVSATVCYVEQVASDDAVTQLDTSSTAQTKSGALTIAGPATGTVFEAKSTTTSKLLITNTAITASVPIYATQFITPNNAILADSGNYACIWGQDLTPDLTNFSLLINRTGTATVLNASTAGSLDLRSGNVNKVVITDTAITASVRIIAPACTTSTASFNAPHGTAPSTPENGDMWTTTAGIFFRVNGVTKTVTTT
jgi:hypothetical protein